MILFVNTASADKIDLALINDRGKILRHRNIPAEYRQSEKLLPAIDKMIGRNGEKLEGIIAVKGPGSFTALRIGLTTANVLAFGWGIPAAGVKSGGLDQMIKNGIRKLKKAKIGQWVMPEYGMEPNITISKISKISGKP